MKKDRCDIVQWAFNIGGGRCTDTAVKIQPAGGLDGKDNKKGLQAFRS